MSCFLESFSLKDCQWDCERQCYLGNPQNGEWVKHKSVPYHIFHLKYFDVECGIEIFVCPIWKLFFSETTGCLASIEWSFKSRHFIEVAEWQFSNLPAKCELLIKIQIFSIVFQCWFSGDYWLDLRSSNAQTEVGLLLSSRIFRFILSVNAYVNFGITSS